MERTHRHMEDDSEASSGGSKDVKSHRRAPGEAAGVGEGLALAAINSSQPGQFYKKGAN